MAGRDPGSKSEVEGRAGAKNGRRPTASYWCLKGDLVAKTSPVEFIRQVQAETKKVVWPSRRETVMTAVMVVLMTLLLGIFFFGVDAIFSRIVRLLLSLV